MLMIRCSGKSQRCQHLKMKPNKNLSCNNMNICSSYYATLYTKTSEFTFYGTNCIGKL